MFNAHKYASQIVNALKEVEDIRSGKKEGISFDEFLNQLEKPKVSWRNKITHFIRNILK
jgi:hypothetical protein